MTDTGTDRRHFTKAVTEFGEKRPILTTQVIFNDRGIKILGKGISVNAGLYERLMAHTLAVPIEDCVTSTPAITGSILRAQAGFAMSEMPFFNRLCADAKTRELLLTAMEEVPLPSAMAFQLTLAYHVYPTLFRHLINMGVFAAWMSSGPLAVRFDVSLAAAAGLLHDIGMLHIDPVLLMPGALIGPDHKRQLESHALVSVALIERHHMYPRELLRAVKEHHEFLDGSGYPLHLHEPAISPLGRILSLGELVTTILTPKHPVSELRLSLLLRMNKHRYDATMVERVLQHLNPTCEVQNSDLTLLPDPVHQLRVIDAILAEWPSDLLPPGVAADPHREGFGAVAEQVAQLRRTLATVGVAPQQLAQLGSDVLDGSLQLELSLLAREAAWQLRALARNTNQHWRVQAGDQYPAALRAWSERAEAVLADLNSAGAMTEDDKGGRS